jgi:uncharacterized protein (TIGR02246 family)
MKSQSVKLHLAAILVLLAALAPARDAGKHASEMQAVKDLESPWNREFEARDLEKMAGHYSDDAIVMAPGMPAAKGKDAIRAMLKAMVEDAGLSLKFQTSRVEVAEGGDMASSQGTYTMTATEPATKKPMSSAGSYVTVYRKLGGEWKAVFDIASAGPDSAGGQR